MSPSDIKSLNDLITPPPFTPTDEQSAILKASRDGEHLVVKAYAGTGKTATAVEIAKVCGRRGRMVLFNQNARRDARSRMPDQIEVLTGHGMAHDRVIKPSADYQRKLEVILNRTRQSLSPAMVEQLLELSDQVSRSCTARQLATATLECLRAFLISADPVPMTRHLPDQAIPIHLRLASDSDESEGFPYLVVDLARRVWNAMKDERSPFPLTHDAYLKILQLRETEISMPGDIWLLDEYQDTNPVLDAIISQQPGQKIYIGDPYQQIYSWRGAVNAMESKIGEGATVMPLSRSFRFSYQVAGLANVLLRALGETVPLKGEPYDLVQMDMNQHHTVLVRNNLSMLEVAADCLDRRMGVYVPGKLPAQTRIKVESALALFEGRLPDVRISNLRDLGSWGAFEEVAQTLGDDYPEYANLVSLVRRHHRRIPALLKACQASWKEVELSERRITMMTAHRAKGREWGYVRLASDLALTPSVINKLKQGAPLSQPEREQVHLLYVAITRSKKALLLPSAIKENLAELSEGQASLTAVSSSKPVLSDVDIRARTAAFIARHRK